MSKYTPNTEQVRNQWTMNWVNIASPAMNRKESEEEFDRWFAEAKADAFRLGYKRGISDVTDADLLNKAKADAWDEGWDEGCEYGWAGMGSRREANPYRGVDDA